MGFYPPIAMILTGGNEMENADFVSKHCERFPGMVYCEREAEGVFRFVFEPGDATRYDFVISRWDTDRGRLTLLSMISVGQKCYFIDLGNCHWSYLMSKFGFPESSAKVMEALLDGYVKAYIEEVEDGTSNL